MADPAKIRDIAERNAKLLTLKPDKGHLTGVTTARLVDGLRCEIADGKWKLAADMPEKVGGEETAPTPGTLGRGALASCLAICVATWAARLEVPLDSVEVQVEGEFDARGELGVGEDIPAGYRQVRAVISIASPASAEAVAEVLAAAERHSPYVDVFRRELPVTHILRLNGEEL